MKNFNQLYLDWSTVLVCLWTFSWTYPLFKKRAKGASVYVVLPYYRLLPLSWSRSLPVLFAWRVFKWFMSHVGVLRSTGIVKCFVCYSADFGKPKNSLRNWKSLKIVLGRIRKKNLWLATGCFDCTWNWKLRRDWIQSSLKRHCQLAVISFNGQHAYTVSVWWLSVRSWSRLTGCALHQRQGPSPSPWGFLGQRETVCNSN